MDVIEKNANLWKAAFPGLKPMINYNATCQPELLNAMKEMGCVFYYDEKIYYNQVADSINKDGLIVYDLSANMLTSYLQEIAKSNVSSVVADSFENVESYHKECPNMKLALRISITNEIYDAGCTMEEVPAIFESAQKQNISISSLCVCCYEPKEAEMALSKIQSALEIARKFGQNIQTVLITGEGFQELEKSDLEEKSRLMSELVELSKSVEVCVDASRFFVEDAYTIYSPVVGKKMKQNEVEKRMLYYTDDGVYCSFFNRHINNEPIDPIPVFMVDCERKPDIFITTIFGPTCDSIDTLGNDFKLPELFIGDWVKYENAGFKCSNYSTRFNGFEDPDIIIQYICLLEERF